MAPRLSIVLPVWRSARTPERRRWLQEALWSLLDKQTFRDFELIVVDDGSDDGSATEQAVRRFAGGDERVRIFSLPENRGQPAALNFGFEQATGDLWTFATDDNLWAPECYSRLVAAIDEGHDLVYGPYIATRETGHTLFLYDNQFDPELFAVSCACGLAFVYTAELSRKVGPYADLWCADFDMWHRMQAAGARIHSLPPPPLAIAFDHSDSVTSRSGFQPQKKTERIPTSRSIVWLAGRAVRKGRHQEAAEMLKQAEQYAKGDQDLAELRAAFAGVLS